MGAVGGLGMLCRDTNSLRRKRISTTQINMAADSMEVTFVINVDNYYLNMWFFVCIVKKIES